MGSRQRGASLSSEPGSVYIAGTGTLAADVVEYALAAGHAVLGRIELIDRGRIGSVLDGDPVYGPELAQRRGASAVIALAGDRRKHAATLRASGWSLATVVHPSAIISPSSQLGAGLLVGPLAVVGARARIGDAVQIGRGALVGHHVVLGDGAVLHPGANLGGNARVGPGATIGIGATVVSGAVVGDGALIAAGAVLVKDAPAYRRLQGVPAQVFGNGDAKAPR